MEIYIKNLRHLKPRQCDILLYYMKTVYDAHIDISTEALVTEKLEQVSRTLSPETFENALNTLEFQLMKSSKFNFILDNIPNTAHEKDSGLLTKTNYSNIKSTLQQIGNVERIKIIKGRAYIRFSDPEQCIVAHNLINNMMMGENILHTTVVR